MLATIETMLAEHEPEKSEASSPFVGQPVLAVFDGALFRAAVLEVLSVTIVTIAIITIVTITITITMTITMFQCGHVRLTI